MNKNEDEMVFMHSEALDILETEITFRESDRIMREILKDYRIPDESELKFNQENHDKYLKVYKGVSEFFGDDDCKITVDDDGWVEKGAVICVRFKNHAIVSDMKRFNELANMADAVDIYNFCDGIEFSFTVKKVLSLDI